MRVKKLLIHNVRSYGDVEIDVDGEFLYFFGLNGSGKTTIGRALLFLVGVEPDSGDIRSGSDTLWVAGAFSPEGEAVPWPLDENGLFWIRVEKERGRPAKYFYKKGEDWVRISKLRVYSFFSDVGASPSQVFLQMGAIPLPFRSASEEHIKRRGVREHRRRRFDALVDLLGLRKYVERLVTKEEELEEVDYKFREVGAKLEEARIRFSSLKRKKELWDEYRKLVDEKAKLKKNVEIARIARVLDQMRRDASSLGEICIRLKELDEEVEKLELKEKQLLTAIGETNRELREAKRQEEIYTQKREKLTAEVYSLKDKLRELEQVELSDEEWARISQMNVDLNWVGREIEKLAREISVLSRKLASVRASREAMLKLLREREEELEELLKSKPERLEEKRLEELLGELEKQRSRLRSLRGRLGRLEKIVKRAKVLVKDPSVAEVVSKVLAIWDRDDVLLDVVDGLIDVPGTPLLKLVSRVDSDLQPLFGRIFVADSEDERDAIRRSGAAAVWNGEIWEWWGRYVIGATSGDVAVASPDSLEILREEAMQLEAEISEKEEIVASMKKALDVYRSWESRRRYIEEDIKAIRRKLSQMESEEDLAARLSELEDRRKGLMEIKQILEKAALVDKRRMLEKRLIRLERELASLKPPNVDNLREHLNRWNQELAEIRLSKRSLEEEIERLKEERAQIKQQLLMARCLLRGISGDLLERALSWKGEDENTLRGKLAAVEANIEALGPQENVDDAYREAYDVLNRMEMHYAEVERWKERAEKDFMALKEGLNRSLKDIASSVSARFSGFLRRFGFDGKVSISVTSEVPFKGEVKVSIMAGDGDWVDYDTVRLSGGEGILIAFSLYLAFWLEKVGDIHMLVVDEAQTNLDDVNFERLMELLMEDVRGQIYVMTMVEPPLKVAENPNARIYHVYRNPMTGISEVVPVG